MYATLVYAASADYTMRNVLDDIVKVATGTATVGNLSPNTDPSSEINTTVQAGWTLWDDVSADFKVIRAAVTDDPTKFKYLALDLSSGNLRVSSYHTWDNVTHSGQYHTMMLASTSANQGQHITVIDPAINDSTSIQNDQTVVLVSASAAHFAITARYQDIYYGGHFIGTEHTRDSLWDTVANGYNPWVYTGAATPFTNYQFNASYIQYQRSAFNKAHFPASDVADHLFVNGGSNGNFPAGCMMMTTGLDGNVLSTTNRGDQLTMPDNVLDENKQWVMPMATIGVTSQQRYTGNNPGNYGGDISSRCGFYIMPSIGGFNDVVYRGGEEYRIWPTTSSPGSQTIQTGTNTYYLAVKV